MPMREAYATILAVPDYRLKPTDKPVLRFEERASGAPEAIEAFFYPGDNFGQQFVYPHGRAVELAKRTNHNVLSMSDDMSKNMAAGATSVDDPIVKGHGEHPGHGRRSFGRTGGAVGSDSRQTGERIPPHVVASRATAGSLRSWLAAPL